MNEPSSINVSVNIPGKTGSSKLQRQLTLEIITDWIKIQGFDDYTTKELIKLAERYPTQALHSFMRNFNIMIERVRTKRRKEIRGEKDTKNHQPKDLESENI